MLTSDATVSRTNATEVDEWKVHFLQKYPAHVTHTRAKLQRPLSDLVYPVAFLLEFITPVFATSVRLLFLYNVLYFKKLKPDFY